MGIGLGGKAFFAAVISLFAWTFAPNAVAQSAWTNVKRERDPVRRARMLPKVGEDEIGRARKHVNEETYDDALHILEAYRNAVQDTVAALKSSGINAEKKSNGFRHLEIHLRKSLRQLIDIVAAVPFERREPFQTIQKDLEGMDKELMDMLFPRQPGRAPAKKSGG